MRQTGMADSERDPREDHAIAGRENASRPNGSGTGFSARSSDHTAPARHRPANNKNGPAPCIPSPCGESDARIAPARADRSSPAPADGYGFRSGDDAEESRARLGESRQSAPLPPGSELVESPHEVSVLELARRDTGALMGLLVLVVLFLFSPGCAPPQRSAATPAPVWCEDCATGGAR